MCMNAITALHLAAGHVNLARAAQRAVAQRAVAQRAFALQLTLVFALFAAGWSFIAQQQALLWQRLPASTVDRFVADQVDAPLPRLPAASELQAACAHPLSRRVAWRRAWLRAELAQCLSEPAGLKQGAAADEAIAHYEAMIDTQVAAANAWLHAFDAQAPQRRAALSAELAALQARPAASLTAWQRAGAWFARHAPVDAREPVGRIDAPEHAAQRLRQQMQATQARVQALRDSTLPAGQRARELALLAAGLQLVTDYGDAPPTSHLTTAKGTLADALEWQRRARGYAQRGFSLTRLQRLPGALMTSALVLMVAVLVGRGRKPRAWPLALWVLTTLLLGMGALMLTDVALTGDASLRYLAERQFQFFGVGDSWVPLTLALPLPAWAGGGALTFWWPLLSVAAGVLVLSRLRDGGSLLLAPLRAWLRCSGEPRWSAWQSAGLLLVGVLCVLFLGMPAAISELLILLGCVGVASYAAQQAAHANAGGGLQLDSLAVAGAALALAVGGSVARGDLGHALVAAVLAVCFAWLFGWRWLRVAVVVSAVLVLTVLVVCQLQGHLISPLSDGVQALPPHAQDRLLAMFDPFDAGSSDLARTRWLIDSAGESGWGLGYVPWQGVAAARVQDGLPLQGPSDYVLALAAALWGQQGGLALMGAVLLVFAAAAAAGLQTALRAAMPPAVRGLAALGGLGCTVMAAKVVLSVGGVTGVLPLTGLPVSLLGYGPVTHLAALQYLALALGTLHVQGQVAAPRGVQVNMQAAERAAPSARQRGRWLGWACTVGLGALLLSSQAHLRSGNKDGSEHGQQHVARARLLLAQDVAAALVPADQQDGGAPLPCDELAHAVAAWNERLGTLMRPVNVSRTTTTALRLDATRLLQARPVTNHTACRTLARTLGQMLDTDLPRLVGRDNAQTPARLTTPRDADAARLNAFEPARSVGARPIDYTTANAWHGQPGCLLPAGALDRMTPAAAQPAAACTSPQVDVATDVATDLWLQRELAPQLQQAVRQRVGTRVVNHREVGMGPALGMTLQAPLQQLAQRTADCYTGRLQGEACANVAPADAAWRQRYFNGAGSNALRAGALGIVLAEVDTGRVVALAGSVSDCSLTQLSRAAQPDAAGRLPALHDGSPCAQLPDQRSAWLAQQHPALWMVPPGSSLKPFSLVAGIDAGLIDARTDGYWKGILAESHEREPIQRTALAAGRRYLDVLAGVGFASGSNQRDLLWGGAVDAQGAAPLHARWAHADYAGTAGLRATSMSLAQAEQIREQKAAGIKVDKQYGSAVMNEFLAARRLADASVGGGDIRINALGLVDAWRSLDLRARGRAEAQALHLVERPGQAVPARELAWLSPQASMRALGMTTGVTATAWKGTAQGSCRVVFGGCAAEGLPGLSGKTGSADFLTEEDSPYVKPGQQLPAKLFGGVFAGPDGKRYAVAVMALRVREGTSRTLELKSSAAAEAALTLVRQIAAQPQPAPGI